MGYVRTTAELRTDVGSRINSMRDKAIEAAGIVGNNVSAESPAYAMIKTQLEKTAWSLAPQLRADFPDAWLHTPTRVRAMFAKEPASGHAHRHSRSDRYLRLEFSTPDSAPLKLPTRTASFVEEIIVEREGLSAEVMQWVDQADTRNQQREEITTQYGNMRTKIDAFLDSVSSLNAALKIMPELELYVPEKYLSRWRKAAAPKQAPAKPEIPDGLDRESLASIGIAHRITTANDDNS